MPEGHSLHRLARQVQDVFGGQALRASSPQGRFADGAALLDGQVLERAWADRPVVQLVTAGEAAPGCDGDECAI